MKILILSLFFSFNLYSQTYLHEIPSDEYIYEDYSLEKSQSISGESWAPYKIDGCSEFRNDIKNENELRRKGMRRCFDKSVSFVQPKSEGYKGWEGKCGQTAASNSLYHLCKTVLDPKDDIDHYLSDLTPGVLPRTLKNGVERILKKNKIFCLDLKINISRDKSEKSFIETISSSVHNKIKNKNINKLLRFGETRETTPVIALIVDPGTTYLHWVTIIDMEESYNSCSFFINHWNEQYQVPCNVFSKWSKNVSKYYPLILSSFTTLSFKPF